MFFDIINNITKRGFFSMNTVSCQQKNAVVSGLRSQRGEIRTGGTSEAVDGNIGICCRIRRCKSSCQSYPLYDGATAFFQRLSQAGRGTF